MSPIQHYEKKAVVLNRLGLHARPATRFAQTAANFQSQIWLAKNGKEVDGKSILEILTIASPSGTELTVKAEGPDAREAVEALCQLINSRFGELD